jgi:hypothetical protein
MIVNSYILNANFIFSDWLHCIYIAYLKGTQLDNRVIINLDKFLSVKKYGIEGSRTPGLLNANQALYQLSYYPERYSKTG